MSWFYLILAVAFEVFGTSVLKTDHRLISPGTGMLLASYGLSLLFLSLALKKLDIGVAYAVWSGLGILSIGLIGLFVYKEPISPIKAVFMTLILIGTVGLNFTRSGA